MISKRPVSVDGAPASTGTHTQAVCSGNLVFLTGQTGRDPATGVLVPGLEAQTRRMLANVDAVLAGAGCSTADIAMVTLMFADIRDFKVIDVIYAHWLPPREEIPLPSCTAFAAAHLPAGAKVMIDVIAALPVER